MPTSLEAMNTLNNRIYAERATGARLVKIIHGYGSTGRGGVIRKECRRRGIEKLKVVYSDEEPRRPFQIEAAEEKSPGHPAPGSVAFVPSVCGLIIAGEVIKDLIHKNF